MQLLDLARTLTQRRELRLETSFHSFFVDETNTIAVSSFWDDYPKESQFAGMKSDVFLRSIGSAWFSDRHAIRTFLENHTSHRLPFFFKQIFSLGEDIRLERICMRLRPGTTRTFAKRKTLFGDFFHKQISRLHMGGGGYQQAISGSGCTIFPARYDPTLFFNTSDEWHSRSLFR